MLSKSDCFVVSVGREFCSEIVERSGSMFAAKAKAPVLGKEEVPEPVDCRVTGGGCF